MALMYVSLFRQPKDIITQGDHDCMVVGFTTNCAISAYQH